MSDTEEAPVEAPVEEEEVEMSVLDALKEVSEFMHVVMSNKR
jgi:hypothetical protein